MSNTSTNGSPNEANLNDTPSTSDKMMSTAEHEPEIRGFQSATIVLDADEADLPKPPPQKPAPTFNKDSSPKLDGTSSADVNDPQIVKEHLQNALIFERSENRWDGVKDYELPNIGDTVGNYKILDELGRGGFGAVYRAKNLTLGRVEALKLILPSAKTECSDIEKRFEREIDIISRLEHPNILTLYSSGMLDHGILWMTTELIQGERLDIRLQKQGAMPLDQANQIMLQLLSGLMEAHQRHIVHRDLKPANIMLQNKAGYEDQVIILDFGLSKAIGPEDNNALQNLTNYNASKRVYGTPQYMAPEQLKMAEVGPWTDVYAAGLIYFELLTGQSAVQGTTLFDVAYKQHYTPIEFPPSFTSSAAKRIIQKACQKQPSERYHDAFEFYKDLMEACDLNISSGGLKRSFYTSKTVVLDKSPLDKKQSDDIYTCETEILDKSLTDIPKDPHKPAVTKSSNTEKISLETIPTFLDDHTVHLLADQIGKSLSPSASRPRPSALGIVNIILTVLCLILLSFIFIKIVLAL